MFFIRQCRLSKPNTPQLSVPHRTLFRTSVVLRQINVPDAFLSSSPLRQAQQTLTAYKHSLSSLLEDRRSCYKDSFILQQLGEQRNKVKESMRLLWKDLDVPGLSDGVNVADAEGGTVVALTPSVVDRLKEDYLHKVASENGVMEPSEEVPHKIYFYSLLLSSPLVKTENDIRNVLHHMRTVDLIEPTAELYETILLTLYFISHPKRKDATDAIGGERLPGGIVGEEPLINRAQMGDMAGYYFGAALSQSRMDATLGTSDPSWRRTVTPSLWATYFSVAATCQIAPKLMDLWFDKFLEFFDEENRNAGVKKDKDEVVEIAGTGSGEEDMMDTLMGKAAEENVEVNSTAALPYDAIHAILSWASSTRDIQRSLRFFKEADTRGVFLSTGERLPPGSLSQRSADVRVQKLQLRLLVKLMATAKAVKMDGGMKKVITNDIKRLIDLTTVQSSSWGIVNDLMSGLSMPSAMRLLKLRASTDPEGDGSVPFFIWASLLRRCAHEHHLDQAESLFQFIRKRFPLTSLEKRELVEIMIRMYATLAPPDFSSALHVFEQHVVNTPEGESVVKADADLYAILIKAADSSNAAMMLFLEGCAEGIPLQYETFEALLGAERDVARLSRKLPHDYSTSSLDGLLSIPSDVDAHMRREEALQFRKKPLYSSTGDSA